MIERAAESVAQMADAKKMGRDGTSAEVLYGQVCMALDDPEEAEAEFRRAQGLARPTLSLECHVLTANRS